MAKVTIDQAKQTAEDSSNGIFLSLADDGDKALVVIELTKNGQDHLDCTEQYWNEKLDKNEPYTKEHKAEGKRANPRYTFNVYLLSQGNGDKMKEVNERKLWSTNAKTFMTVLKVRDKYGLGKWVFEVERKGKKKTRSDYQIMPEKEIDGGDYPGLREKLAASPPLEFEVQGATNGASSSASTSSNGSNGATDNTASKEVITELLGRLKAIPREKAQQFLTRFGLEQVRGLKASDVAAAKLFVDQLEGKAAPAAASDNDPFLDA